MRRGEDQWLYPCFPHHRSLPVLVDPPNRNAAATETDAGHFLQEEVPEVIAEAIVRVVDKLETATPNVSE